MWQGIGFLIETRQNAQRGPPPGVPRRFHDVHNVGKLPVELAWFGFHVGPGVNPDVENICYLRDRLLHRGIDKAHARIPQVRIGGCGMHDYVRAENRSDDPENEAGEHKPSG